MPWEAWRIGTKVAPSRRDAEAFLRFDGGMTLTVAEGCLSLCDPMKRSLLVAFSFLAAAWCAPSTGGADVPIAPRRGVLLLNNGELIEGTITAAGDRYDVRLADGQIRVHRSQVALAARDVRECYLHRRAECEAGSVQDCVELAEWCLRHGLVDEAEREIATAKIADETYPKIPLLETRLRLARSKPKVGQTAASNLPKSGAEQIPAKRPLDLAVRELPAGSVETFANHIQPLLLNYCAGSGCHAAHSAGVMRLERIPPNRFTGRKSTQRNLQSVLATIDRENPLASKLLTLPIAPHGGRDGPIFTGREQTQYRQLVAWVYQVAGARKAPAEPTQQERIAPLLQQGPNPTTSPAAKDAGAGGKVPPGAAKNASGVVADGLEGLPAATTDGISTGSYKNLPTRVPEDAPPGPGSQNAMSPHPPEREPFVPRDSFDPEIFNRRYFPD